MKRQRIYVDTSVIGGCFDDEFSEWSNKLIGDFGKGRFKPILSEIVNIEIQLAPKDVISKYEEVLNLGHEFISIDDEVLTLFEHYKQHKILSDKYQNDMLHVALASVAEVDILVSWNFRHMVRFDKIRLFNAVNIEMGYRQIDIYSPREVCDYEEDV